MTSRKNRELAIEMIAELGYDRALSIAKDKSNDDNWLYIYQAIVSLKLKPKAVRKQDWIPKFSVINTQRMPYRQIESLYEPYKLKTIVGRADNLLSNYSSQNTLNSQGTSIFNPTLAHIAYDWFSNENDVIFDPFCGGPVRGVVASLLGRKYYGIDIRKEQIEANQSLFGEFDCEWQTADATTYSYPQSNMILTSPPYHNLEVYSTLQNDLSNQQSYNKFLSLYATVIEKCCNSCDRYIVFVIGNIRHRHGHLIDFPGDTIKIFESYGFKLHNEIIIYAVGSAAQRINFNQHKVTNVHQKMLVFRQY